MSATPAHAPASPTESTTKDPRVGLLRVAKAVVVFVYIFVLVDLVMLALGFFLRLFGASTDADFTRWVYRSLDRIMEPFRGMFPTHDLSEESVLDVSLLFAMIVYSIFGIALHALVAWLTDKIAKLGRRQRVEPGRAQRLGAPTIPPEGAPSAPGYPASHYPPVGSGAPGPTNR
ncbi:MAG: hypothetical protein ACRD2C_05155 [Acidimicrobiales bacterium]